MRIGTTTWLHIRRMLWLSIAITLTATGSRAQERLDSITDEDFVTASLIVTEPGNAIYSVLGHCALRMECPSEGLDYCFTLETEDSPSDFARFFSGKQMAALMGVATADYLSVTEQEGREVKQYRLNLTIKEKQLLWRHLDEEIVKPPHLRFDYLCVNCLTSCLFMIEQSLIDESLDFSHIPDYMKTDNGQRIRHHSAHAPWSEFLYITLCGGAADGHQDVEHSLSPMYAPDVLSKTYLTGETTPRRPLLSDNPITIVNGQHLYRSSRFTPRACFLTLLLLTLLLTAGEWLWGWRRMPRYVDAILLAMQTIIGVALFYFCLYANLFGTRWNWYLIPFLPLPAILHLLFRHKASYPTLYLVYATILLLFIAATPLSSQLDLDHQLISATLLVRCASKYFSKKFLRPTKKT